jgi:hypothetical protein
MGGSSTFHECRLMCMRDAGQGRSMNFPYLRFGNSFTVYTSFHKSYNTLNDLILDPA